MSARSLFVQAVCFGAALTSSHALAQGIPSTDPTEPVNTPPTILIPMPGSAPAVVPAPVAPEAPAPATPTPIGDTQVSMGPGETRPDPPTALEPNNIDFGADNEGDEVAMPGDPFGDTASAGLISIRALFQARYISTFSKASTNPRDSYRLRERYLDQNHDGWELNRIFMRLGSDPSKYVGFKVLLDFSELYGNDPEDVVKQAYVNLRPLPTKLEFTVGLFKLPFSTLELDASSRFEFSEYGAANKLGGDLGFSGRDLGAQVLYAPLKKAKRMRLTLGAYQGHAKDEHDSPVGAVAGRIEAKPNKHWRLGADMVQHTRSITYNRPFTTSDKDELPNPPNPLYPAQKRWLKGHAMSADLRYKRKALMLRGEGQYGDRIDRDTRYGAKSWFAAWGLAAYRVDINDAVRLLPAVRFEWFDGDREHRDRGVQQQISFATTILFWDRVRLLLEATRVHVQKNTPLTDQPKPIQTDPYLAISHTRVVGQLQVEL